MDKLTLTALLDEDREMVLANLKGDTALSAAQVTLEKAIDRVMYGIPRPAATLRYATAPSKSSRP